MAIGGSAIALGVVLGAPAAGLHLQWLYLTAIAQAVTLSGIVLVSLLTELPEESQWRPFQWTLAALTRYDEGVKRPWHQRPLLWWSMYTVGWAYLHWRFW
ncbi:MAG: hypothetical protein KA354_24715 [Phycisphaerae bacterium]|nr:hypothetical protein [Phycisphaerae bacterium]